MKHENRFFEQNETFSSLFGSLLSRDQLHTLVQIISNFDTTSIQASSFDQTCFNLNWVESYKLKTTKVFSTDHPNIFSKIKVWFLNEYVQT